MTEAMVPRPEDPYGISKYAVELDLAAAHEMFGLQYTIFRPHNVYGARQDIADRYRNDIGIFMNNALRGRGMRVHIRPGGHAHGPQVLRGRIQATLRAEGRSVWAIKEIYDRSAFVDLCRRAGRDQEDRDGFFPPYRSA